MPEVLTAKERPIPFMGEMVRATLDGRKTQTRRVIKPQPRTWGLRSDGKLSCDYCCNGDRCDDNTHLDRSHCHHCGGTGALSIRCPYGKPGDRLWVRETWAIHRRYNELTGKQAFELSVRDRPGAVWRKAVECPGERGRWRSARFMPRAASVLSLEVTDVRVERVQEISHGDALEEGIERYNDEGAWYYGPFQKGHADPRVAFSWLWDSINAKRGYPWSDEDLPDSMKTGHGRILYGNPWVWVVEFKRV